MAIRILDVAERALRRPLRDASITARTSVEYDPFLAGRTIERVAGLAETSEGERLDWTAIVKRTEGPGLRAARRELAAYRAGVASPDPDAGLRAPALLGFEDEPARVEVWLEALADRFGGVWPNARFGVAARHIAAWDARMSRTDLPPGFDSEDAWAERHGQAERAPEALAELDTLRGTQGADEVAATLDDPGFDRTAALIRSTQWRIDRLAAFPQTPLHHDLVRANLFALADGGTAAIDWENVGRGPLGVDLAPLVVGSVRRGEASADDLPAIESLVLDEYVAGLREVRLERDREVVSAYRLALGLRWHVVLGAIRAVLDPTTFRIRGSRPDESREEGLRHLIALARHLLDAGEPDGPVSASHSVRASHASY